MMCSVNDVEDGLKFSEEKRQVTANQLSACMKCGEDPIVLVRARDPMCRPCFIHYFTHKFRATLGKSKAIRQGEKVLIAFSGGPSSCSLLQLLKEGLSESAHKKLRFNPDVVVVDESAILGWAEDKRLSVLNDITQFSKKLGFDIDIINIEKILVDNPNGYGYVGKDQDLSCCSGNEQLSDCCATNASVNTSCTNGNAREKLQNIFQNVKSLTAKQDLLYSLRARLLRDYAKEQQCTKIIVAETSTRLAIKLLLNIAQGRGGSLPYDIGVSDNRDDQVAVIRPMRELTSKEVVFYNRVSDIESIVNESLDTMVASNASLQKQTESFITSLQASFPSTISTIFRTGDKLTVSDDLKSTDGRCVLCQTPVVDREQPVSDKDVPLTSTAPIKEEKSDNSKCCGEGNGSCQNSAPSKLSIKSDDLSGKLCYGCRLTFKDMGDRFKDLPPYVMSEFERSYRRSQMKEKIQEFLLD